MHVTALEIVRDETSDQTRPNMRVGAAPIEDLDARTRLTHQELRASRLEAEIDQVRTCQAILMAALHRIDAAIFVLGADRRVVLANAAAKDATELSIVNGALTTGSEANAVLQAAVTRALGGQEAGHVVLASSGRIPLVATIWPVLRAQGNVPGATATAVVVLSNPESRIAAGVEVATRTFRLTASEARLLSAIAAGDGLRPAAATLKIGTATARTHLQRIFAKTRTQRQSELMRLVATLAPPVRMSAKA